MNSIIDALKFGFIQRALIVGVLIGISTSTLGIFLVLKKYSMIGDGLAHVSFSSVAISLFLGFAPIYISLPIVIIASIFILKLNEKASMHADSAIAVISSFAVALGVIIASVSKGFNIDLFSYLFGSILLIDYQDVIVTFILTLVVLFTIFFKYKELVAITYDEDFAKVMKMPVKRLNYLLSILTAITVVIGIRIVGTMLISSMIIFPSLSALQLKKSFKLTVILAQVIAVISVVIGIFASYILNLPTGATIVFVNGLFFIFCFAFRT